MSVLKYDDSVTLLFSELYNYGTVEISDCTHCHVIVMDLGSIIQTISHDIPDTKYKIETNEISKPFILHNGDDVLSIISEYKDKYGFETMDFMLYTDVNPYNVACIYETVKYDYEVQKSKIFSDIFIYNNSDHLPTQNIISSLNITDNDKEAVLLIYSLGIDNADFSMIAMHSKNIYDELHRKEGGFIKRDEGIHLAVED